MIPRSTYWKLLALNYNHNTIMGLSAIVDSYVEGLSPPWNVVDWDGIAEAWHAGSNNVPEDIMVNIQYVWGSAPA